MSCNLPFTLVAPETNFTTVDLNKPHLPVKSITIVRPNEKQKTLQIYCTYLIVINLSVLCTTRIYTYIIIENELY